MRKNQNEYVFNEQGEDQDFRVESDTNPYALFVDAGADHVNVGSSTDLGGTLNVSAYNSGIPLAVAGNLQTQYVNRFISARAAGDGTYTGYLLICPVHAGGANEAIKSITGTFFASRGGTSSGNIYGKCDVSVSTAFTNTYAAMTYREGTSSQYLTNMDRVTFDGTDYVALRFAQTGGSAANGIFFTGQVRGLDDNCFTMKYQTEVTVVQADYGAVGVHVNTDSTVVINENGLDRDFRVESDANSAALFVQASDGNVGIGTITPSAKLHTTTNVSTTGSDWAGLTANAIATFQNLNSTVGTGSYISFYTATGSGNLWAAGVKSEGSAFNSAFIISQRTASSTATERMRINALGNVLVGKQTDDTTIAGVKLGTDGSTFVRDSNPVAYFNRETDSGEVIVVRQDNAQIGSINSGSGALSIKGTTSTGIRLYQATGTGSNERQLRFFNYAAGGSGYFGPTNDAVSDELIDLGTSDGRWKDCYIAGGVYLGGAAAGNKLDDYEEGTWNPSLTSNLGTAYGFTSRGGTYTKIGNIVTASGYFKRNSSAVASGNFMLIDTTSLPYVNDGGATGDPSLLGHFVVGGGGDAYGRYDKSGYIFRQDAASNTVYFLVGGSTAANTDLWNPATQTDSDAIYLTLTYKVA